jgi:preprotein translocase subunit SecG
MRDESTVTVVRITLQALLVLTSLFLMLLILLHKGRGGGLSDMFGGGVTSNLGSSGVAERNLNRFTIAVALVWTAVIVLLGVLERFA